MRSLISNTALIFLCLAMFNACSASTTTTTNVSVNETQTNSTPDQTADAGKTDANSAPSASDEIKKVDFKNFTYEASCASETREKLIVKKGEYSRDKGEDKLFFNVMDITYGDVDGDKSTDAIVLTVCNTGGTGQFSEGFVYKMKNGKPVLLTRIQGGDRADGGLRSAKVESGLLVVEANINEGGGACCPEGSETTKYKWNGKELVAQGTPVKRELYPATRVSFQAGKTFSEMIIKLPAGELKRYVVSAGAGQTLTVTSDNKNIAISLVKGDADESGSENDLVAKLSTKGNYVIQFQNTIDKDVQANVVIEIK